MNNINVIGLDIAKQTFHLVGLDHQGNQVVKKKLRRAQLLAYFANLTQLSYRNFKPQSKHQKGDANSSSHLDKLYVLD